MAKTRHTQPKVTTADLKRKYDTVIVVNRSQFRLRLFKALKPTQTYGIAVGQVGLETPAGQYTIANKAVNPAWHVPNSAWAGKLAGKVIPGDDPTNPIKARWLGIFDGVGIHGTSDDASIGHNASHGCIRMHVPDVEKLYDEVPGRLRRLHRLVARGASQGLGSLAHGPDLVDRDLLPPALQKQGMVVGVSKHQRADEDAPLTPAQDREPQRRGVGRALDAMPRARRLPVRADGARVDELAMGGDLTVAGVDEEHPHGRGG